MARRLMIAGNWKMYKNPQEARELASRIAAGPSRPDLDILVIPTFLALTQVVEALQGSQVLVGGQNLYWEKEGPFTGEISGPMLKSAGATHVLVAHSERRQYFGETEETAGRRVKAALQAGLIPVLCVGETEKQRLSNQTEAVLASQLAGALESLSLQEAANLVIAYEPVWAIGTGLTASEAQAQAAHAHIRAWLAARFNKDIASTRQILYGGSVKPANAAGLLSQEDIDGALVGGASLQAESFLDIVAHARN